MQIKALGRYGPYPPAGGATSGYLLRHEERYCLVDCGAGTFSRMLSSHITVGRLEAIFLSHLHFDHMSDMGILSYALEDLFKEGSRKTPLPVYLPASPEFPTAPWHKDIFELRYLDENTRFTLGDMTARFCRTNHPVECYAMRFETPKDSIVYSADSALSQALTDFARDAQLLICDAKFFEAQTDVAKAHFTAKQAAQLAKDAGVKRLLLTHLPANDDLEQLQAEARQVFANSRLIREGVTYQGHWNVNTWLRG